MNSLNLLQRRQSVVLLSVQIFGLLSFFAIFYIRLELLWVTLATYFFTACIGGTITYHRLLSHRAFACPKWFRYLGTLFGVWGFYGSPLAWASVHRLHHKFVDTKNDPHSPLYKKWWQVQWLSVLEKAQLRNVSDLLSDRFLVFVHRNYFKLHLAIIIFLFLIDPWAIFYAYLWPAVMVWNIASSVNYIGHKFGYRNFETRDSSRNNPIMALLVFGEGWHNNHHARPNRASFRLNWWEIDIGEWIIWVVERILVKKQGASSSLNGPIDTKRIHLVDPNC